MAEGVRDLLDVHALAQEPRSVGVPQDVHPALARHREPDLAQRWLPHPLIEAEAAHGRASAGRQVNTSRIIAGLPWWRVRGSCQERDLGRWPRLDVGGERERGGVGQWHVAGLAALRVGEHQVAAHDLQLLAHVDDAAQEVDVLNGPLPGSLPGAGRTMRQRQRLRATAPEVRRAGPPGSSPASRGITLRFGCLGGLT